MTHSLRAILAFLFLSSPALAQHRVACDGANGPNRWKYEAPYFKQAPHGAYRPDKYHLVVKWEKGIRQFADTAPYWETDAGGTAIQYCGFDLASRMHILSRQTDGLMSGLLVDDRTGAVLPGGEWVLFSPDQKHYLAGFQWHGAEYPDWAVYTTKGQLVAGGTSRICAHAVYCGDELDQPWWSDSTHLVAMTNCEGKHLAHTLDLAKKVWSWTPASPCPAEEAQRYPEMVYRYEWDINDLLRAHPDSAHKLHAIALTDLESALHMILQPFDVPGFGKTGRMNNDDMFKADEDFDRLDGLRYLASGRDSVRDDETMVVVTADSILGNWLDRHWGIPINVPLSATFMSDRNPLSMVFPMDAAAVPYIRIPTDSLRALGLTWGWIGNFEQDDCPCTAGFALFMVSKGRERIFVALHLDQPIPPPDSCVADWKPTTTPAELSTAPQRFRACYEREALRDPRLGQLIAQIRKTATDIRR